MILLKIYVEIPKIVKCLHLKGIRFTSVMFYPVCWFILVKRTTQTVTEIKLTTVAVSDFGKHRFSNCRLGGACFWEISYILIPNGKFM